MAENLDANAVRNTNEPGLRTLGQLHNPLLNIRDRLFYTMFCRVGLLYARSIPRQLQRALEFVLLFEALLALGILTYIHMVFVHEPVDCLRDVYDSWPKDGIVRVEIIKNASDNYDLLHSYKKLSENSNLGDFELNDLEDTTSEEDILEAVNVELPSLKQINAEKNNATSFAHTWLSIYHRLYLHLKRMTRMFMSEDTYILEYALEYGFLRMSPKIRNRRNVTVMLVILDPTKHECFGGWFSQLMLDEFLGYEDILLSSLQQLAKNHNNSGFLRNVWSGDHYRFIEISVSRVSYITAAFLMIFFTLSISMLLRYAHQQIFLFLVDFLQVFDRNALVTFPLAPLLTAILALIGVEALMSELFIEPTTAFYVILVVWLADQYDVICCHTNISKRHWLRFFYLYHFVFYAYHYRFNGYFSSVALATSWLFIQHSMVYFFHHYELPTIINQARFQRLLFRAQQHSLTLHTSLRDGHQERPEGAVEQQATIGTVVALLPEDMSGGARAVEATTFRPTTSANRVTERLTQHRGTWNRFSLPSFRISNSLILAQIFVQQPQGAMPDTSASQATPDEHTTLLEGSSSTSTSAVGGEIGNPSQSSDLTSLNRRGNLSSSDRSKEATETSKPLSDDMNVSQMNKILDSAGQQQAAGNQNHVIDSSYCLNEDNGLADNDHVNICTVELENKESDIQHHINSDTDSFSTPVNTDNGASTNIYRDHAHQEYVLTPCSNTSISTAVQELDSTDYHCQNAGSVDSCSTVSSEDDQHPADSRRTCSYSQDYDDGFNE